MNPYKPLTSTESVRQTVPYRTPITLVHAALIGLTVAAICPAYLATLWHFRSNASIFENVDHLARTYVGPSLPAIPLAMLCGTLVPSRITLSLSMRRYSVPLVVNTMLFSAMFTLIGHGYLNNFITVLDVRLPMLAIFNSAIVGAATFLHVACRPSPSAVHPSTQKPSKATLHD